MNQKLRDKIHAEALKDLQGYCYADGEDTRQAIEEAVDRAILARALEVSNMSAQESDELREDAIEGIGHIETWTDTSKPTAAEELLEAAKAVAREWDRSTIGSLKVKTAIVFRAAIKRMEVGR